ncbi:hypothetical protein TrVE_jg3920 [Triparma verrucosa]|uniref:Uncharacterized protein n=1 Tax=Triparma verrucosa TaxID=1606542 RepID=A0A9W7F1L2_9STRA|nr:hypothetical protein TrVE_jg3920 [Triparma verrucosa]
MMLWYTPVLQITAKWYDCFEDTERIGANGMPGYFLVSYPTVKCPNQLWIKDEFGNPNPHLLKNVIIQMTTGCLCLFVGIGFPVFIVWKTKRLRNENKLNADSAFSSLYDENYIPSMPYFEAVHFLSKALLIFSITVLGALFRGNVEAALIQALSSLLINTSFFSIIWKTKPQIYFPCSLIKNKNINNLAELTGAGATIVGNLLAVIGSFFSQIVVNDLGIIFAII